MRAVLSADGLRKSPASSVNVFGFRASSACRKAVAGGIVIPIAFHVIHSGAQGNLSQADVEAQIDVMNAAYQGTGVQFLLEALDYTDNAQWYTLGYNTQAEIDAKTSLGYDTSRYLNINLLCEIGEV